MSLFEAMLLDPVKMVQDVYFTPRNDRQAGCGTESDPYTTTAYQTPPIAVTLTFQGANVTATAQTNHSYVVGDMVTIAGVTGPDALLYNSTFVIHDADATTFQFTMKGTPSADANGTASRRVHPLDERLRALDAANIENIAIHIGPGTTESRGAVQILRGGIPVPGVGWRMRRGWKIVGSGMEVTVIKLVGAPSSTKYGDNGFLHSAIGGRSYNERADYAEVQDLTVDCAAGENRGTTVGAVALIGSHTRVRRVRAINFGTEVSNVECFVISVAGAHPDFHQPDTPSEIQDCVIADCIVEQPGENNVRETTCLHTTSGERPTDAVMAFHRGCAIRNSYVNTEFANGVLAEVQSIEFRDSAGQFTAIGTLTTKTPHRHSPNKNLVLHGAANASTQNPFNGVFPVIEIVSQTVLRYEMFKVPTANPTGTISIGHHVPSHWVKIDSITLVSGTERTYRIKTRLPHYRTQKNNLAVFGVKLGDTAANPFNGTFPIDKVVLDQNELEPTILEYTLNTTPQVGTPYTGDAYLNPQFQALSADGGTATVVEGNRIIGCRIGGPYHDTWSTRSLVVRKNLYHDVQVGPYHNIGGLSHFPVPGSALAVDPTDNTRAIFTALQAHGLQVNDTVRITSAVVRDASNIPTLSNPFNLASATVLDVPADPKDTSGQPLSFKYQIASVPSSNAWSGPLAEKIVGGVGQGKMIGATLIRDPNNPQRAIFTTFVPHGLNQGDIVTITGAIDVEGGMPTLDNPFNKSNYSLQVGDILNNLSFSYQMDDLALGAVAYSSPIFEKMVGGVSQGEKFGSVLIHSGQVARFTTIHKHGLLPGDAVRVEAALVNGSLLNSFNFALPNVPAFQILSVPSDTSFTYQMVTTPAANAFGAPGYRRLFQVGLVVIEENIIELLQDRGLESFPPQGISMGTGVEGINFKNPYLFRQGIVRRNIVRQIPGLREPRLTAISLSNFENALVESNIIDLAKPEPMQHFNCGFVRYFNNRDALGNVLRGNDPFQNRKSPDLARDIEDAMILAL